MNLISAAFWLNDPTFPTYVVRVYQNGPGGTQVGTTKRGRLPRPGADPEMIVIWTPGECPLVPNQTYYIEVTKDGGGTYNVALVNTSNPYAYGDAYLNGSLLSGTDLAGTLMEEASAGSATQKTIRFLSDPTIVESNRGPDRVTLSWVTDVSSDSRIEYAVEYTPYAATNYFSEPVTNHFLTVSNLQPNSLYHFRVTSSDTNSRPAISRDFVGCTRNAASNLLANGSFEEGSGASPRAVIPGWNKAGMDIEASSGNWFFSLKPTNGSWFCQGAVNGSGSDGYIYQQVSGVTPGLDYTFSAWVMTAMRENGTWKYDVWDRRERLIYARLGIDPTGGTDPNSANVQWTPRFYSHLRFTQAAKTVLAQSNTVTVFVRMTGSGGEWHLYGIDDCVLTHEEVPLRFGPELSLGSKFHMTLYGKANETNIIEASTNLSTWGSLGPIANRSGTVQFSVPAPTNFTQRFFRARQR